ncbi:MAG: type II toxin-antitoxin system RatA family toxin [Burkholderiales bacterium]|jgi:ribosome-associated toxin RatA of RatAB toxin-antitoxin module|nr:type II toxin-antitoxin system RatA family toxin [Burkholderiales bacterium]
MKHVKKSVLLWYSAREMYDLVVDVESYPKFLPWCESSTILERHEADPATGTPAGMTARLGLSYAGVRQSFTTRNEQVQGEVVKLKLVDGPFSNLDGIWQFKPLNKPDPTQPPSPDEPVACKVEFDLAYAFSNRVFEAVLSPVFDQVANTFVDSFVKRAAQVYGER